LETSGGLIELIPLDKEVNPLGEDLNNQANSRYLAMTTRVGMNITGPDVWGAKTSGNIEFDFNGYGDQNSLFRIRHAFFRLDWTHHALILGQTWHPLVGCATPDEFSYAAGAPYNTLNRSPQIQYNYKPVEGLSLKAAVLWQLQYTSVGPSGIDNYASLAKNSSGVNFSKYSIIPDMYAGLGYNKDGWEAGAGVDVTYIRPRTKGKFDHDNDASTDDITRKVDDHVWSFSPIIYAGWTSGKWSIKAKSILAQNLSHTNTISGYAVTGTNSDGSFDYTPLTHTTSYINVFYGKKYKVGIYAGYSKNLGLLSGELATVTDTKGTSGTLVYYKGKNGSNDIDQNWRICPSFSYNLKHFNIGVQYELSGIDYGTMKKNGTVGDTHSIYNHRVLGMVKYNF
ncbi:MAG: hypothetical protein J6P49_04350, partial [Paludibacteraceae bacterium]|nr:hypothetical protein [Paludibacteraceae bacterium]